MAKANPVYQHILYVTHEYFGPAADRFITRQVQNHLHKEPQELNPQDIDQLVDWIRVAVSLLSNDPELIEAYLAQLCAIPKRSRK